MDRYGLAIEELCLSGEIGLGCCSRSTLYRWVREINSRLEFGKYDWRVKGDAVTRSIVVIE